MGEEVRRAQLTGRVPVLAARAANSRLSRRVPHTSLTTHEAMVHSVLPSQFSMFELREVEKSRSGAARIPIARHASRPRVRSAHRLAGCLASVGNRAACKRTRCYVSFDGLAAAGLQWT